MSVVDPKYANTVDANVGVFYVAVLQHVNTKNKKVGVFYAAGLEYANTGNKKNGAKNVVVLHYAEAVGVILEETENTRVIVCPAL